MGILTLHSQNRLGSILDACMQREKCLPYFYVKILHQKNVITFFKWDLVFFFVMHVALREEKINENQLLKFSYK